MSPDARGTRWRSVDSPGSAPEDQPLPLDVRLEALDAELRAAGARARAAVRGSTQPTRYFSQQLRSRLVSLLTRPAPRE
jgi:hypothetical protein